MFSSRGALKVIRWSFKVDFSLQQWPSTHSRKKKNKTLFNLSESIYDIIVRLVNVSVLMMSRYTINWLMVFSYRGLEFKANLKTEKYKDSVMEANWAGDTLTHFNSLICTCYTVTHMPVHRHTVGLEGLQCREVGVLQQCVPITQGHLKWIGMRGGKQFP